MQIQKVIQITKSEEIGRKLKIGSLADSGILGLQDYLEKKTLDNRGIRQLQKALILYKELQKGIEIRSGNFSVGNIDSYKLLNSLKKTKEDQVEYIKEPEIKKHQEIIKKILDGDRTINDRDIKNIQQELDMISSTTIGSAIRIIERTQQIMLCCH